MSSSLGAARTGGNGGCGQQKTPRTGGVAARTSPRRNRRAVGQRGRRRRRFCRTIPAYSTRWVLIPALIGGTCRGRRQRKTRPRTPEDQGGAGRSERDPRGG